MGLLMGRGDGVRRPTLLLALFALLSALLPQLASGGVAGYGRPPCPRRKKALRSAPAPEGSKKVSVVFRTDIENIELTLVWISDTGVEKVLPLRAPLSPEDPSSQESYPGHAFRIYAPLGGSEDEGRVLIHEYVATTQPVQKVLVGSCKELEQANSNLQKKVPGGDLLDVTQRRPEFEALRHPGGEGGGDYLACEPAGRSSRWSCVRRLPRDVCEKRHQNDADVTEGKAFGFQVPQGKWKQGSYEDLEFDWQQSRIPRVAKGPGFLVMNMTEKLRKELLPWYAFESVKPKGLEVEAPVPGGFINDEQVKVNILNLDRHPQKRNFVIREMKEILEWWTGGTKLQHKSTFGVRVYRRGNVLLNHVDRRDTHLVSAILQLHQEVDEDGGWPVEILSEDRDCFEVYLQPGQMVLYEGARFKHGRPMAFPGEAFANIFSHFAPSSWTGLSDRGEL